LPPRRLGYGNRGGFSLGSVYQLSADPTNTHNVWTADFLGIEVNDITESICCMSGVFVRPDYLRDILVFLMEFRQILKFLALSYRCCQTG
jgi:hypothetical protein